MIDLPDIDIDFAKRTGVLEHITHTPARLETGKQHNTGVYFTDIPRGVDGLATMGINNKKIKLIIWFDNGWGYASRIIDTIKRLGQEL